MTNAKEFTLRLHDLLARERVAMADFLLTVADFDAKSLWLDLGYASLFDYLHRELGLSKASTFLRASAARLLQRFPEVIEPLRDGRLCLSSMGELAKALTPENKDEVLPRFFHLSKREAKAVAAAIRPDEAPPRREVVTAIRLWAVLPPAPCAPPTQGPAGDASFSLGVVRPDELDPASTQPAPASPRPAPTLAPPPSTIEPLTAELVRIHLTADKRLAEKLERAKDALSHARPGAGIAEVLEAGLDLLLERHAKRRGLVEKPRSATRPASPDHVPAHVKREVWARAQGRCEAPLASGGVCGSTRRLELHHVVEDEIAGTDLVRAVEIVETTARRRVPDRDLERREPRRGQDLAGMAHLLHGVGVEPGQGGDRHLAADHADGRGAPGNREKRSGVRHRPICASGAARKHHPRRTGAYCIVEPSLAAAHSLRASGNGRRRRSHQVRTHPA